MTLTHLLEHVVYLCFDIATEERLHSSVGTVFSCLFVCLLFVAVLQMYIST